MFGDCIFKNLLRHLRRHIAPCLGLVAKMLRIEGRITVIALFGTRQNTSEPRMITNRLVLRRDKTAGMGKQFRIGHLRLIDVALIIRLLPVALAAVVAATFLLPDRILHLKAVHAPHACSK